MPDVLICYEHIAREVSNASILKYELESRGISCEIMHFNGPGFFYYSKRKNRSKVVLCPWLRYNENVYHYLQLCDSRHKLIDLQCEQVYCEDDIASGLCNISGESQKASHICWGQNSYERLRGSGIEDRLLPITGAVQLDYGGCRFVDFFLSRDDIAVKYNLDSNKRWCLYISSFGYANYDEKSIKEQVERFGDYPLKLVDMHKNSQNVMLDWVEKFLKECDCEFIYRPHPSENLCDKLYNLQSQYDKFHVISDGTVKQWAKVCDSVNLWISTSNAELLSMDINYEIVRPIEIPGTLEVESMKGDYFITTYEDFRNYNIGNKPYSVTTDGRKKLLSQFYSNFNDNKPAYKRIADYIETQLNDSFVTEYQFGLQDRLKYGRDEFSKKIISLITEYQIKHSNVRIIDYLPIKKQIKVNLKKRILLFNQMQIVQSKMIDYLSRTRV